MYCTSCGTENREGTKFCKHCGSPMGQSAQSASAAPQPQPWPWPQPQPWPQSQMTPPVAPMAAGGSVSPNGPASVLKRIAASPVFLAAVILSTLSTVLSIIFANSVLSGLEDRIYDLIPRDMMTFEMEDMLDAIFDSASSAGILSTILSNLPAILILIGLWITVVSAFNKSRKTISTTGLTVIRVLNIIGLVLVCIGFAAAEIGCAVLTVVVLKELEATGLGIGIMIGTALMFALVILYYVGIIGSLKSATGVAVTGKANPKASVYVAVLLIIGSVFNIIGALFAMPAGIASILSAVAGILFAVTIFKYRGAMEKAAQNDMPQPAYEENMGSYYNPQAAYGYGQPDMGYAPAFESAPVYTPVPDAAPPAPEAPAASEYQTPPVWNDGEVTAVPDQTNQEDDSGVSV